MARSGVWQDCQSLPTRTLHQQVEPHDCLFVPHNCLFVPHDCLFIPHDSLIVPTHRLLSSLVSCSQEREAISTVIHIFLHRGIECVSIHIWDLVWISLTHWVLRCYYSRGKLGAVWSLLPTIFPVESHFYAQGLCSSRWLHC